METKTNRITEGIIWKELLIYAFPLMMGTIVQQCYTLVDTIVVGRFVGKAALASVGGPAAVMAMMVVTFFNGLANGVIVVIAQYYGARNHRRLDEGLHTAYGFAIIAGVIVSVMGVVLTPWLLRIMNTTEEMLPSSTIYLRIYFGGIIFTLIYNIGGAIMRAIGDSKRPFRYLLVCSVMNIVLDLLLVVVLNQGIAGAAIATVLSQGVSAVLVTGSLMRAYDDLKLELTRIRLNGKLLWEELKIGIPGALQACAYGITNVIIQACINEFGTDTAAAWAIYGKADMITWTVASALGAACTTFVGQNYGAGKMDRVYKSFRSSLLLIFGITGTIILILYVWCGQLYYLFTTDQQVIRIAVDMLRFLIPFYLISFLLEGFNGTLRGLGKVFWPTVFVFVGLFFVRMPWIVYATDVLQSLNMLMISYPAAWMTTLLFVIPYYVWDKRKRIG